MDLSKDDYNILIEALDSWVKRDFSGKMFGDIMTAVLFKGDEEGMAKIKEEREAEKAKQKEQEKRDEEIAVLLKSKLILMRNKIV